MLFPLFINLTNLNKTTSPPPFRNCPPHPPPPTVKAKGSVDDISFAIKSIHKEKGTRCYVSRPPFLVCCVDYRNNRAATAATTYNINHHSIILFRVHNTLNVSVCLVSGCFYYCCCRYHHTVKTERERDSVCSTNFLLLNNHVYSYYCPTIVYYYY